MFREEQVNRRLEVKYPGIPINDLREKLRYMIIYCESWLKLLIYIFKCRNWHK